MVPVKNPSRAELRQFGLVMVGGFGALGAVLWVIGCGPETGWAWSGSGRQIAALGCWALGVVFCLVSLSLPVVARLLYIGWMTGAMYLGMVMTTLLLSIVFFLVLPVFALIKLKDPLRRRLKFSGSYWEDHKPHEPTVERMMRPF